jgi:flagellar biosynthesis protein FlhF
MRIKSYFAKSMDEALGRARAELGSDALLLNTRRLNDDGKAASYEVVMGLADDSAAPAAVAVAVPPPLPVAEAPPAPAVPAVPPPLPQTAPAETASAELEELREKIEELQSLLARQAGTDLGSGRARPELAVLHARLIAADIDAALSRDIVYRMEAAMSTDVFCVQIGLGAKGAANRWKTVPPDASRIQKFFKRELARRVPLRAAIGANGNEHGAVAAFVGPAGAGKSTSIAKLALAASEHMPVRIVSLDAPGWLLESVAKKGRIRCERVPALESLPRAIAEARRQECVLIDTPGFGAGETQALESFATALARCPGVDVHLVAPAYMAAADLRRGILRFRKFHPEKLLVTKTDEARTLGAAISEAARAGLALSFLGSGPRVTGDIRPATLDELASMVLAQPLGPARRAA